MVRRLTGALVDAGRGVLTPEAVQEALLHPSENSSMVTCPPQGLFLWRVVYPDFHED
jgi:tRNA pseudouridine38-40 synthase